MEKNIFIKAESSEYLTSWTGDYALITFILVPFLFFVLQIKITEVVIIMFIAYACTFFLQKRSVTFEKFILFFGFDKYMYFTNEFLEIKSGNLFGVTKIPYYKIRNFELQNYDRHTHATILGDIIHSLVPSKHERMEGYKLIFYGNEKKVIYEAELLHYEKEQIDKLVALLKNHVQ